MSIFAHVERSGDVFTFAVFANRLSDGENVRLVERAIQRTAAVAAGAKTHQLLRIVNIRLALVISSCEFVDVDQNVARCRFSSQRHESPCLCPFFDHWPQPSICSVQCRISIHREKLTDPSRTRLIGNRSFEHAGRPFFGMSRERRLCLMQCNSHKTRNGSYSSFSAGITRSANKRMFLSANSWGMPPK